MQEMTMNTFKWLRRSGAVALVLVTAGCATWHDMDRNEKGTAVGATSGALAGAVVAGPVGAVVGAGVGGYAGHHQGFGDDDQARVRTNRAGRVATRPADDVRASPNAADAMYDTELVRTVQRSLNDRGFDAGPADGQWGPNTEAAVRDFQQANGIAQTGNLDPRTINALGVAR
jgi:hypothetical protein